MDNNGSENAFYANLAAMEAAKPETQGRLE